MACFFWKRPTFNKSYSFSCASPFRSPLGPTGHPSLKGCVESKNFAPKSYFAAMVFRIISSHSWWSWSLRPVPIWDRRWHSGKVGRASDFQGAIFEPRGVRVRKCLPRHNGSCSPWYAHHWIADDPGCQRAILLIHRWSDIVLRLLFDGSAVQ